MDNIQDLLKFINPATCSYQEWTDVGMALKQEGYQVSVWDSWSQADSRYHPGECARKWASFSRNDGNIVTGGTIYKMAVDGGYKPDYGHELGWDDEIVRDDEQIISPEWVESEEIKEPDHWDPVEQITTYLNALFEPGENVGYVMQSWNNEKKYVPQNKGNYDRTAGELVEALTKCKGDIGSVLGDYDPKGGAWIRFNPLDGKGVKNENVTDFRYALVESDDMEISKQNAILRELKLPIAVLVYSGGKSLHAIIRIEAADYKEYRSRVDYLYDICKKNGLAIDTQNRNPSRLSRLPGVIRGEKKQFIVDTNIGFSSWNEWKDYVESVNDDLPDIEDLSAEWNNMPDLADELIKGVLRKGHKMLISGPSKAGKSFLQIELVIAIAEGKKWLEWDCMQGRVLYVNLELDRASCLHRFKDVYTTLGWNPNHIRNIDIWNLRGRSIPMDKLVPRLLRRAKEKQYTAIVIDPIYKVITGDENSASEMARFCNQFDKIATELGCAVIYCHHHSKGMQGGKRAMDRASGSGVFARDPDALLDMIELPISKEILQQQADRIACREIMAFIRKNSASIQKMWNWENDIGPDDELSINRLCDLYKEHLGSSSWFIQSIEKILTDAAEKAGAKTAWRIDGTLREFPKFQPVNVWFDYPIHCVDDTGILSDIQPEEEKPAYQRMIEAKKKESEKHNTEVISQFEIAFEGLVDESGCVRLKDIAEEIGVAQNTIGIWLGKGKRSKKELKKEFISFTKDDDPSHTRYVKRKE